MFFVAERQTRPLSPVATEPGARRGAHAPGAEHVFRPVARGGPFPGEAPCALRASSVPLTQPRGPNATETEIESGNGTQRRGISLRLCDLGPRNAVTAAPTAPSHLSRLRTSRSATACHAGPPVVPAGRVRIARAGPVRGSRRVHACARTCVSRLTRPGLPVGLQSGGEPRRRVSCQTEPPGGVPRVVAGKYPLRLLVTVFEFSASVRYCGGGGRKGAGAF